MKTFINLKFTLVLLLITSAVSFSQIAVGVKLGSISSTQEETGKLFYNNNFKIGLQTGLQADYRFHSIFSTQIEANYISKGSILRAEHTSYVNDVTRNFNYINVPLLLKARFDNELGLSEKTRVFLYAGPYYSYLISTSDYLDAENISEQTDIENDAYSNDIGLTFGTGFTYVLESHHEIFVDIRYDMGFSEVLASDTDLRNKSIGISLGYRFF